MALESWPHAQHLHSRGSLTLPHDAFLSDAISPSMTRSFTPIYSAAAVCKNRSHASYVAIVTMFCPTASPQA